jgi:1-deoxy-D-xylulose-5-phosphate reductoisomerase
MKKLSILGSTGSIGKNVLEVVKQFPENFKVSALAAATNIDLLTRQIEIFKPEVAVVLNADYAKKLSKKLGNHHKTEIVSGDEGYKIAASHNDTDIVVSAIVGAAGLLPTVAAIKAGKNIALANKETLVMAGDYVMSLAEDYKIKILPVDSEHSAVFQCLNGHSREDLSKIILTASGGPFRQKPFEEFPMITPEEALNHPTWEMGKKISIDSATLMNKGLEVIEAKHLFGVESEMITVVVHPQSIVHSMVSFIDGSVLSHMGAPDMRGAIAYALSWPERLPLALPVPDFAELGSLEFEKPDMDKFPCLSLAFEALKAGGTMPAVLNAANESAVYGFLNKKTAFIKIPEIIERTMQAHSIRSASFLDTIIEADKWARHKAEEFF